MKRFQPESYYAILTKLLQKTEKGKTSSKNPGIEIASYSSYIYTHARLLLTLSEKRSCYWENCLGILYWDNSIHRASFPFQEREYCNWTNSIIQLFLPCNCVRNKVQIYILAWSSCSCQILHGLSESLSICAYFLYSHINMYIIEHRSNT